MGFENRARVQTLKGHDGFTQKFCLTGTGNTLYSGSNDQTIIGWDWTEGRQVQILKGFIGQLRTLCLSHDRRFLFSGTSFDHTGLFKETNRIIQWDLTTGNPVRFFDGFGIASINTLGLTPDGRFLFAGSPYKWITQWDVKNGNEVRRWTVNKEVHALCISGDGNFLYGAFGPRIIQWDIASGKQIRTLEAGDDHYIRSLCLDNADRYLYSGSSQDHNIIQWDLVSGQPIRRLEGHRDWIRTLCPGNNPYLFSSDGDGTIKVWDISTGQLLVSFYHLDHGFLFTTPPDDTSPSGYFWTDREDLIDVIEFDQPLIQNRAKEQQQLLEMKDNFQFPNGDASLPMEKEG